MPKWKGGTSGNPKGRPPGLVKHIREICREYTEEAIGTLVDLMRNGDGKERLVAAKELLDRGFGKPHQSVEVNTETTTYVISIPTKEVAGEEWEATFNPAQKQITQ